MPIRQLSSYVGETSRSEVKTSTLQPSRLPVLGLGVGVAMPVPVVAEPLAAPRAYLRNLPCPDHTVSLFSQQRRCNASNNVEPLNRLQWWRFWPACWARAGQRRALRGQPFGHQRIGGGLPFEQRHAIAQLFDRAPDIDRLAEQLRGFVAPAR